MAPETVSPRMKAKARLGRAAGFASVAAMVLAIGGGYDAGTSITAAAPTLPAPPASGEMGFVSVQFHEAFYSSGDQVDCPDGMTGRLRDHYMASLPKAEQDRLNKKENEPEREKGWRAYATNAKGGNVCANIYEFMDMKPTALMKGPIQWGLNLDDDVTGEGKDSYTCKHQNFTSPAGEKGIDHQLWRAQGCNDVFRGIAGDGKSDRATSNDDFVRTGQITQVLLLKGVNSLVNDPDVQVIYANTEDRPTMDSRGKPIFHGSYSVAGGNKLMFRNELRGRIKNGVLTTDAKDIHLIANNGGARGESDLQRGRIRLEFQPDGSIKGLVGGYERLLSVLMLQRGGGAGTVNNAGINCAGEYTSLRMMADGDKDPKTGQCRRISYAYELVAVPGFINDVALTPKMVAK